MSLPTEWVDKIFTKLTLAYGREFLGRWEGLSITDVKTDWAHELSRLHDWPEGIAFALANLPVRPPTVIEFRAIAYRCERKQIQIEHEPKADKKRMEQELAKLSATKKTIQDGGSYDHKAWVKAILRDVDAGVKRNPTTVQFAREALRA